MAHNAGSIRIDIAAGLEDALFIDPQVGWIHGAVPGALIRSSFLLDDLRV